LFSPRHLDLTGIHLDEFDGERDGMSGSKTRLIGIWSHEYIGVSANGQALVTAHVAGLIPTNSSIRFVYGGIGRAMLFSWLSATARLWSQSVSGGVPVLYLVCSRSVLGFIRDLPAYAASLLGSRIIVHVHGSSIVSMPTWPLLGPIVSWALRRCEIVVPSPHLLEPLNQLRFDKVYVCENFTVSGAGGSPDERTADLSVLWNSSIMASKGFYLVADAVEQMNRDGIGVKLVVIGEPTGDDVMGLAEVTARFARLKFQPWFEYHGKVDRPVGVALLAGADVVCLPSRYKSECQPLALIEAMCAGRALVIADTPALRATVGSYPCETLTQYTTAELADTLIRINQRPRPFEPERAAAEVARIRFSVTRFDQEMRAILGIDTPPAPPS
jgi:glycosyltransferase involved in cell wall biosynthesis